MGLFDKNTHRVFNNSFQFNYFTDINQNTLLLREIYFNTKFRSHEILRQWFEFLLNSVYLDGYREIVFLPGKYRLELEDYLETEGVEYSNEMMLKLFFIEVNTSTIESIDLHSLIP